MNTTQSPLMQALTGQMRYMSQRQGVIAQNIANKDTPGYKAQDLKKVDFANVMQQQSGNLQMTTTSPKHLGGGGANGGGGFGMEKRRDTFETTPVGNNVSLEEQMANLSDTGTHYQISSSLVRKFVGMYRSALGNR